MAGLLTEPRWLGQETGHSHPGLLRGYPELFLLRPGDAYRAQALEHRLLVDLGPPIGEIWVHSPEDLILYKLRYFRISRQPKHVRDIASIMLTLGKELELDYITSWSERLDLTETWQEVQEEVHRMSDTR